MRVNYCCTSALPGGYLYMPHKGSLEDDKQSTAELAELGLLLSCVGDEK